MPIKERKIKNEILIPLRKFAHSGPYSESHLYRLARLKKIKVKKVGCYFYTTLRWYNDFLLKENDNKPFLKIIGESKLGSVLAKHFPDKPKGREKGDIDEKLTIDWQNIFKKEISEATGEAKVALERGEKYLYYLYKKSANKLLQCRWLTFFVKQKVQTVKQETSERLISQPWIAKLVTVCIIALFFSISIGRLTPATAGKLVEKMDNFIIYPIVKTVKLAGFFDSYYSNSPDEEIALKSINRSELSSYIVDNQDELAFSRADEDYAIEIKAEELYGRVAGAAEQAEKEPATGNNLSMLELTKSETKSLVKKASGYLKNVFNRLAEKQKQLSLNFNNRLVNMITK